MELWKGIALIPHDEYFTRWIKETGRLDHHQGFLSKLKQYLRGTVLDIGANIGTHTHFYSQHAEVHAFEPNPIAYECLAHNCPNVNLYNVAVGAEPGFVSLVPDHSNPGATYTTSTKSKEIPVITIDSLHLEACNFIKIDVEGDEIEVLLGARSTIAQFRPVMCIECNETTLVRKGLTSNDLIAHLNLINYSYSSRKPNEPCCDLICTPN